MSRALLVLADDRFREKAIDWIRRLPKDTRVEFKKPRRTLPQNDRMWAMLTDVATQKEHCGRKYPPETWKALMMQAWGKEVEIVPTLDGRSVFPIFSSSDLSKDEMSELMEFMSAWGAENGVVFHDPGDSRERAA
jgi:hypothetical protein